MGFAVYRDLRHRIALQHAELYIYLAAAIQNQLSADAVCRIVKFAWL